MSVSIDQAFITQFESEVKLAYQQTGSKLRNTVRLKTNVTGSTCRFPKVGKGEAGQKSRHGDVPVMNAEHAYVDATLEDWYAGDYVDKLDELKTNIEERQITVNTGAYALGRKIDKIIITAALASLPAAQKKTDGYNTAGSGKSGLADAMKNCVEWGFEKLNSKDVPDAGNRLCRVGSKQWNRLLNIDEFSNADYIGPDTHPWVAGTQAKRWLNTIFALHTGLNTANSDGSRICIMYHRSALGLGEGTSVITDITWQGTKAAWFIDNMLSAGAVRIDSEGVVAFYAQETA